MKTDTVIIHLNNFIISTELNIFREMNMNLSDIKTIMESGDKNKLTEYLIQEKS